MQMFISLIKITREYEEFKAGKDDGNVFGNAKGMTLDNPLVSDTGKGKYNISIYLSISRNAAPYYAELRKGDLILVLGKIAQTKSAARVAGFYSVVPWMTIPVKCQKKEYTETFKDNEVPF